MSRSICRCVRGVLVVVLIALAALGQSGCRRADDDAATNEARVPSVSEYIANR